MKKKLLTALITAVLVMAFLCLGFAFALYCGYVHVNGRAAE